MKRLGGILIAAAIFLGLTVLPAAAADFTVDSLAVSYSMDQEAYTLSWDAVDPSTTNANVSYRIYFASGAVVVSEASAYIDTAYGTTYLFRPVLVSSVPYGTYSFRVYAYDTVPPAAPTFVDSSPTTVYHFLHDILRGDGAGQQVGHKLLWNISGSQQADAKIFAGIYPPGTTFTTDSNGFLVSPGSASVKVLMDNVPRSAAINDYKLEMTWDSHDSSGAIVPNGVYWLWLKATDINNAIRDSYRVSIPVDILRIMNVSTERISSSSSVGKINYTITGDMLMTFLICRPGTQFITATADGSLTYLNGAYTYTYKQHDPLPINASGVVDGSRLLKVMRYYREQGTHTETWNGTDETGVPVERNIYAVTISGRDDFSNFAVQVSGNDAPIADTLSVDLSAPTGGSSGGSGDLIPPTVVSITPANGETVTTVLASVSAVLSDTGGSGISTSASTMSVRNAAGAVVPGTLAVTGNSAVYTFTNPITRATNGIYSVSVTAVDNSGNQSSASTATFTVNIEDPNVFAAGIPVFVYPNPAQKAGSVSFSFNTNRAATVKLQIFNMLGDLVHERSFTSVPGAQTASWNLQNDGGEKISSGLYIYRIVGEDGGAAEKIVKKLVVIQ